MKKLNNKIQRIKINIHLNLKARFYNNKLIKYNKIQKVF